jgi:hypothetical protein
MSKKKNTLKDLDEFLKQQAATLVAPKQLSDTIQEHQPQGKTSTLPKEAPAEISTAKILDDLKSLAEEEGVSFRKSFYDLIIRSVESQKNSLPEDKMLINTALYLKSGSNWKDVIREYWKSH